MGRKTRILAVDDDKDILYTLQAIGTTVGWHVDTESNSIVALSRVKTLKPDLILIDYHMPQQNGIVTIKQIRQIDGKVPIIVLTVDDRQVNRGCFFRCGCDGFCQ